MKGHPSLALAIRTARALIKFCDEHDGQLKSAQLHALVTALEADDRPTATRVFKSMLGGNGSFADWFPPVKFENETPEYVQEIFEALTGRWYKITSNILLPK